MHVFASALLCARLGAAAAGTIPSSEGSVTVEPGTRLLYIRLGNGRQETGFLAAVETFFDWKWPKGAVEVPAADAPKNASELIRHARAAYDRGDRAAFLKDYEEVARLRPGDTYVLYNLACAQSINGQGDAALRTLREYAAHRVWADLDADGDFDAIRKTEAYAKLRDGMETIRKQRISSGAAAAFRIPEKELAPEGVAYDPSTRSFFVASVRKGKIVRIGQDGKASDFVAPGSGIKSALGIGVDSKRRALWVASEAIPMMNGAREGDPPDSTLFEFDLDTGKLRREYRPAASDRPPYFDDLTVGPDGRVYVNDGRAPRIFTVSPGKGEIELFLESDVMGGTQGLALTPDGSTLYASDYRGLYRIDVASKGVTPLPVPADLSLNGIDGLVWAGGGLVSIQNGIRPHRVIRLELAPDGLSIASSRILEMNHPDFDEPTLGTVVDRVLYFSANNQGHLYRDTKNPPKSEDLREAVILKLPLPAAAR